MERDLRHESVHRHGARVVGDDEARALWKKVTGFGDDRIKGLRAGGDDYLPKPYSFAELQARVEVLSRRNVGPAEETTYRVGDLELDRLSHRVAREWREYERTSSAVLDAYTSPVVGSTMS